MSKVKLLEQFIEEGLFDVVTKSKAFVKNPISATKITNNGKNLVQAEIDNAAADLDYEKRKLASKKASDAKIEAAEKRGDTETVNQIKDKQRDSIEVLKQAHKQKTSALDDKVKGIKDRIDDLAKNNTLKELGSLVKTAARVKRNEVLIKGADEEEKKQLKVQLQKDMEKIDNLQKGFGEYKGSDNNKTETSKEDEKTSSKSEPEPSEKPKSEPEPSEKPKSTEVKAPEKTVDPLEKLKQTRADLSDSQQIRTNIQNKIKDLDDRISSLKAGKYDKKKIQDPAAEISSLEDKKKEAESRLNDAQLDVEMTSAAAKKAEEEYLASKKTSESFLLKNFKDFVSI